jgi:hypothetical protein
MSGPGTIGLEICQLIEIDDKRKRLQSWLGCMIPEDDKINMLATK